MAGDAESCDFLSRLDSDTIILKHSQSPAYDEEDDEKGEETEISEKNVPVVKKRTRSKAAGLKIQTAQDLNLQISPILPSPTSTSPVAKRQKSDENENVLGDYWCDVKENQLRMEKILCSHIDIREIYQNLLRFKSVIPCPRPLLVDTKNEKNERCRWEDAKLIDDRKAAIHALFSRRKSLKLSADTLHLAVALLDQCLDKLLVDKQVINDLAAVALLAASKVEEVNYLSVSGIIDSGLIEKQSFSMVCVLERLMLSTLSFQVTFPTPFTFATYLLVQANASPTAIHLTHYLLELSVLYVHNRLTPSDVIAHSAVCLAFGVLCETSKNSHESLLDAESLLQDFCGIAESSEASRDAMRVLADLFLVAPSENHGVFLEYSTSRRDAVALRRIDALLQKTLKLE